MTRYLILSIFLGLLMGGPAEAKEAEHTIQFFYENVCASCHEDDKFYELFNRCISPEEKAELSYEIRTYNLFVDADRKVYEELLEEVGIQEGEYALPVLAIDGQWVSGYDNMEEELHGILVEGEQAKPQKTETEVALPGDEQEDEGLPAIEAEGREKVALLFTTYSCQECSQVKDYLAELKESEEFRLVEWSIAEKNYVQVFKELLKASGREEREGQVPAVFIGEEVLLGKEEIEDRLPGLLSGEEGEFALLKKKMDALSQETEASSTNLAALFGAGLLAGFNPCSISMLLMLFSILLTAQASVLKNGALYLAGKYITYLGLGAGIAFAASKLDQNFLQKFGTWVNGVIIVLFLAAAVMNFLDFIHVKNQQFGKIRMQLPKRLRRYNHRLLKKTEHMEGAFLGLLVLGLGIAISLGEFFCTGQIYMASILYMLKEAESQFLLIFATLLVYVTAMSIPAAAILVIIHKTRGTGKVSDFMLRHMGAIKLLNSFLFLCYAFYFIF